MEVTNALYPTDAQYETLRAHPETGEIQLLNLFKFREKALYPDGRDSNLSGKEAYDLYGKPMREVLTRYGAQVVYFSELTEMVIGQVEDLWDAAVIVKYPSRKALLEMTSSEEFKVLAIHREAGLEGQLNIEIEIPN
ncbi:DUF1330 domain-containing protein [Grimontia kaedaensis]|uniref:DUF1330 domain-containing protein n=1 Tax=Grimontia kaedaensis TaxID=2872157 RepID=A0ABY4WZR7_9GAMM|nr:DUF1330 domain-containing protein [Grimontia kaedaensis]USH04469.1 DUF1330 domain-containing protein [Grimontia kaedaensis]